MDFTPVTTPPSTLVHDRYASHGRRQSTSRSGAMPFSRAPAPLPIPNARYDPAPPPLPPPRYIDDITAGSDPGWAWGNDPKGGEFGKARESVMPMSNFPKSWGKNIADRPLDPPEFRQRESSTSTVRSPVDTSRAFDFSRHQDEGYYSLSGPRSSAMSQQLHGERQLQQKNLASSSQAYDNKLLSKIGKPQTPPRNPSMSSIESSPTSNLPFHHQQQQQPHPNQLRHLSFPHSSYSNSAYSDPPIKKEPSSGYGESPRSRPVSPGLVSSASSTKSFMDWRSPPSSAHDSEQYPHYPQRFPSSTSVLRQQKSRRSTNGSLLSSYDESAANSLTNTANTASERPSPLKRESYDHANFFEHEPADSTLPMEDSVRKLRLEDRPPLSSNPDSLPYFYKNSNPSSLHTSRSRPGMKRKPSQSPPPPDPGHEANPPFAAVGGNSADLYQRNTSTPQHPNHRLSPGGRQYAQNQGSFSSQSSAGPRNNSYASSAGLSVASSVTTLDQNSPGISPSSEQQQQQQLYQQHNGQDSPYVTSLPIDQGSRNPRSQQQYPQAPIENHPTPPADQKQQHLQNQRKNNPAPSMQPPAFICACCPKKPKKFDTLEELRVHESEKQYSCMYCANRFKNKNEAERHQNSLHLRKHSWSCAVLNNSFDRAFYPSNNIPSADNNPSQSQPPPPSSSSSLTAFDTCGYCGAQFPNEPAPDWEARGAHLNGVHKFGECNQSKKFFRADHFRQHLKHSHAGTSGKWTNMLETACMRDEPPPTAQDNNLPQPQGAPVANMGMGPANVAQGNMGQANMGQANMGQDMSQNMGQANMGQGPIGQASMGQVNLGQDGMGRGDMGQGGMAQNMGPPKYGELDMSNIDPNIGMQQMGGMGGMANMGNMGTAPGRGIGIQGGQMRSERIEEMPQEM